VAARLLLDVLDHWSQAGPGTGIQHWYTMRYVVRLLMRVGADEAGALHRELQAFGLERPAQASASVPTAEMTGTEALAFTRECLTAILLM
jgi:hypothetical protein